MPIDLILLSLALLGHGGLWIGAGNRIHATAMPRRAREYLSQLCAVFFALLPACAAWWRMSVDEAPWGRLHWAEVPLPATVYLAICWIVAVVVVVRWIRWGPLRRRPEVLRSEHVKRVQFVDDSLGAAGGGLAGGLLARLPGNEILRLRLTQRTVAVPRLPETLDGLSIVHLADFHFSGWIGKAYFQQVVRLSNEQEPDLVAVTGDLVDRAELIDWIPETFGRLRARHGVCYVLGNHDRRVDCVRLRRTLDDCGLIGLGNRWIPIEIRGQPVVLAGNELPWFRPAADMTACPNPRDGRPLRIVLAHSPDQIDWARARDVDLLLAGHTHGGQICLPLIGPLLCPCRTGVKYASGLFHVPPTIMQVTRGTSGLTPVRYFCPPEMVHLVLRSDGARHEAT